MTARQLDRWRLAVPRRAGLALVALVALGAIQSQTPIAFTDIAERAGIGFVHHNGAAGSYWYPELFGGGVAVRRGALAIDH